MNQVDIAKKNVIMDNDMIRKCDYKCSYSFQYPETTVVAVNSGDFVTLTCENYNNRPAKFNSKDYNVNSVMIFAPSLHMFRGQKVKGEFIIEHTPTNGGKNFYVCLPITEGYNSNSPLAELLNQVSVQANEKGESFNNKSTEFTLQNIVPLKPYYYYEGYFGTNEGDFIVYDIAHGLTLDSTTLMNLSASITANSMEMLGGELSYNPNGPSQKKSTDLYISCRPVGTSEETVAVKNQKQGSSNTEMSASTKDALVNAMTYIGIFIILVALLSFVSWILGNNNTMFGSILQKVKGTPKT